MLPGAALLWSGCLVYEDAAHSASTSLLINVLSKVVGEQAYPRRRAVIRGGLLAAGAPGP